MVAGRSCNPAIEEEVRALGPVRHLVSPNKLHHLFLAAWRAKFPGAKLWGTPSTVAQVQEARTFRGR